MSTLLWPPLDPSQSLPDAVEATRTRELEWLLSALQETLSSLKAGLDECASLLAPKDVGATLVVSSHRSEALKGFVTRNGSRIVKGDMQLRLPSLPPPRGQTSYKLSISAAPQAPSLQLHQLADARTLINASLDVVDATCWTGDAHDANFIIGQLTLLHDNIRNAKTTLKGGPHLDRAWVTEPLDEKIFDPPLPSTLSFHLSISDAALLLQLRTLEHLAPGSSGTATPNSVNGPSFSGFGLRDRLAQALGAAPKTPAHDEAEETFTYKGTEVRVKDKVRVESQDPSLISAMAKLAALEHSVELSRRALYVVMGREGDEQ